MIQNYTYLDVADNSGAKQVMCFHVLGGSRRRYGSLGDIVVVAVKEAIPQATVKKGDVSGRSLSVRLKGFGAKTGPILNLIATHACSSMRRASRSERAFSVRWPASCVGRSS